MYPPNPKLTVTQGLAIQRQQLDKWKQMLREEFHQALEDETSRQNQSNYADGYAVWRGGEIDNFVFNTFGK